MINEGEIGLSRILGVAITKGRKQIYYSEISIQGYISGSFVQRQKRIAIYHVKKFVKESQLWKQTLSILPDFLENWHFLSHFVWKSTKTLKLLRIFDEIFDVINGDAFLKLYKTSAIKFYAWFPCRIMKCLSSIWCLLIASCAHFRFCSKSVILPVAVHYLGGEILFSASSKKKKMVEKFMICTFRLIFTYFSSFSTNTDSAALWEVLSVVNDLRDTQRLTALKTSSQGITS